MYASAAAAINPSDSKRVARRRAVDGVAVRVGERSCNSSSKSGMRERRWSEISCMCFGAVQRLQEHLKPHCVLILCSRWCVCK